MGLGNVISQTMIEKRSLSTIDWPRVTRFAAYGYIFTVYFDNIDLKIDFFCIRDRFFDIGITD
jgi:hypothetical protein